MQVNEQVRQFILSTFYVPDAARLEDSVSLLDSGIIDSTSVLDVIAFIESTFGFTVEESEMVPDNLGSIANIAAYVARKRS